MSSNKLSFLIEQANFDWRAIYIDLDGGSRLSFAYPVTPNDYLSFAKSDIEEGKIRGHVNAVANAKRAIDCQTDTVISALGYNPAKLKQQLGKSLSAKIEADASDPSLPIAFKFLESIGISTPSIVGRVRSLRHTVEHRYQKPTRRRAIEALEIATLFVAATERGILEFDESFGIGCRPLNFRGVDEFEKTLHVRLSCSSTSPHASVVFWQKPFADGTATDSPRVTVLPEHECYYWLVRMGLGIGKQLRISNIQPLVRGFVASAKASISTSSIRILGYH